MSNKLMAKSAGIIGAATLFSRILGFIRDVLFAAYFGTGISAQAFVVAFRIPNLLRDIIGEGATNSAVVPVLVEELAHNGKDQFWRLANILLNILLLILTFFTICGFLFAKPIVTAIAPGFLADPAKHELTVALTRLIFPFLIFIGLAAYAMGVLNALKHFALPAFSMALLNVAMIIGMVFWKQDIYALAIALLIGGFLQFAVQVPALVKKGITFKCNNFIHPKIKKIGWLLVPRIFGTGVYQINIFVSTILASLSKIVGEGAVAAMYFSNRLLQFPLAVFAFAIAQAALPTLSSHIVINDMVMFKKSINFQLRAILFLLLPSSAGLIALAVPITKVLLQRGVFSDYSTAITANALFFYSFGLLAYGMIKILVGAFYSMQDTKTPVKIAAFSLVINLFLNVILMFPLKLSGLALATSISGIVNALLLFLVLRKRIGSFGDTALFSSFRKISFASLVMGLFAFWINDFSRNMFFGNIPFGGILGLITTILCAIAAYVILCVLLNVKELQTLYITTCKHWSCK